MAPRRISWTVYNLIFCLHIYPMDCLRDSLHTNSAVCLSNLSTSVYLQMYVQCSFFRVSRHTNTQLECVIIAYSYWVACWHEEAAIFEGGWGEHTKNVLFIHLYTTLDVRWVGWFSALRFIKYYTGLYPESDCSNSTTTCTKLLQHRSEL